MNLYDQIYSMYDKIICTFLRKFYISSKFNHFHDHQPEIEACVNPARCFKQIHDKSLIESHNNLTFKWPL